MSTPDGSGMSVRRQVASVHTPITSSSAATRWRAPGVNAARSGRSEPSRRQPWAIPVTRPSLRAARTSAPFAVKPSASTSPRPGTAVIRSPSARRTTTFPPGSATAKREPAGLHATWSASPRSRARSVAASTSVACPPSTRNREPFGAQRSVAASRSAIAGVASTAQSATRRTSRLTGPPPPGRCSTAIRRPSGLNARSMIWPPPDWGESGAGSPGPQTRTLPPCVPAATCFPSGATRSAVIGPPALRSATRSPCASAARSARRAFSSGASSTASRASLNACWGPTPSASREDATS